jgi:ankyrin repeat protein
MRDPVRVAVTPGRADDSHAPALFELFTAIASGDLGTVARLLDGSPELAAKPIRVAATRAQAENYFLARVHHYVYAGDTALHIAAAAYNRDLVHLLLARSADVRAANRRGSQPLHYAADGGPDAPHWDPPAQRDVIGFLIRAGADPNALDRSGVAPLHRAVRNRCAQAAHALIDGGADPRLPNGSGSTPLHLAVQNTGKSRSGTQAAKTQQRELITLLLRHGARPTDRDKAGKSVAAVAPSAWIRDLLGPS